MTLVGNNYVFDVPTGALQDNAQHYQLNLSISPDKQDGFEYKTSVTDFMTGKSITAAFPIYVETSQVAM